MRDDQLGLNRPRGGRRIDSDIFAFLGGAENIAGDQTRARGFILKSKAARGILFLLRLPLHAAAGRLTCSIVAAKRRDLNRDRYRHLALVEEPSEPLAGRGAANDELVGSGAFPFPFPRLGSQALVVVQR